MTLDELKQSLGPGAFDDLCQGIKCEAEHDAELLAVALARRPSKIRSRPDCGSAPRPRQLYTLALLAMLPRIQCWHDKGLVRYFKGRVLESEEVIALLWRSINSSFDDAAVEECRGLAVEILTCWMKNSSWSARRTLGVEVVLGRPSAVLAHTHELADFLRKHHHIANDRKGTDHGDT